MIKTRGIIISLILASIFLTGCSSESSSKYTGEQLDSLAQCLTENEVVMYGTFWCPHCSNSKKKFGSSFGYINYIECDPKCKPDENGEILSACKGQEGQPEVCLEKNIEYYDTWLFKDGSKEVGEPSLETLDSKSGCNLIDSQE